jgi:hypothetical protein
VKKLGMILMSLIVILGVYTPSSKAAGYDSKFCEQFKGVSKIWWDGIELKPGQIGRLIVLMDTPLFKLQGEKKVFSRTLKAGEFYRIYAFKPGMLSVGGGYFVDRDSKVKYETPSKTKLQAVQCIHNPYGSISNPTALGEGWEVKVEDRYTGFRHYEIGMVEAITDGDIAWQMIKEKNYYNDPPPAGKKYVMAKFYFKLINADKEPFNVTYHDFEAVSKKGVTYSNKSVVIPDPELWKDLYKGGSFAGWTVFLVDQNDEPKIVWNRKATDEIWFKMN